MITRMKVEYGTLGVGLLSVFWLLMLSTGKMPQGIANAYRGGSFLGALMGLGIVCGLVGMLLFFVNLATGHRDNWKVLTGLVVAFFFIMGCAGGNL